MLIAQALGEYAGTSILTGLAAAVETAFSWTRGSVQQHMILWIAGAVLVLWFLRRR